MSLQFKEQILIQTIKEMHDEYDQQKASVPVWRVQEILDSIESIPDQRIRNCLFMVAREHLRGSVRDLIADSKRRAGRKHGDGAGSSPADEAFQLALALVQAIQNGTRNEVPKT